MKPIYHYSTVSEALDELNELGLLTIITSINRILLTNLRNIK
jgi:hypothetical protein